MSHERPHIDAADEQEVRSSRASQAGAAGPDRAVPADRYVSAACRVRTTTTSCCAPQGICWGTAQALSSR